METNALYVEEKFARIKILTPIFVKPVLNFLNKNILSRKSFDKSYNGT